MHKKDVKMPRGENDAAKSRGSALSFCNFNVAPYDDNTAAMGSRVPA